MKFYTLHTTYHKVLIAHDDIKSQRSFCVGTVDGNRVAGNQNTHSTLATLKENQVSEKMIFLVLFYTSRALLN